MLVIENCNSLSEVRQKLIDGEEVRTARQEPYEDAVNRDMALEKMADYVASGYADSVKDFEEYSRIICQLPPVTPQPKMGRWIYGEDNSGTGRDGWYCNQCGHFEFWDYSSDLKSAELNLPNLCPNCKAKMQEVEN